MNKRLAGTSGLILLTGVFLLVTAVNNALFSSVRLDLTENNLYTLSDGSREIVEAIDEPINLYFFFSEKVSEDLTALRAYSQRVQELLEEYELAAGGGINLTVIDPEPFSESEDRAAGFGLQSVPVNAAGDELYFGLAGTNALDDTAIISFFQPDKEEFLEYEVSKMIQELNVVSKPVVGILSSLPVQGDVNMQTFQSTPGWMSVTQLESLFELKTIEPTAESLPEDVSLLVVIHPKGLSESLQFAIDQYLMGGGRMLAFVDPMAEMDRPAQANPMMPQPPGGQSSDLNNITAAWGVTMRNSVVIGDSQFALQVGTPDGRPVRHLAILGLTQEGLPSDDVVTAELEAMNLATAGIIDVDEDTTVTVTPLITSSGYAGPLDTMQFQFLTDPSDLQNTFSPTGQAYNIAVRVSGPASTAFPEGIEGVPVEDVVMETEALNVILVADTDILTDRLWVQVQNFFGSQIASPFADNGDFLINAVENLNGSASLISIRSRGRFTRPFDVVQDIRREAEARYLESANDLQAQLTETENRLAQLQPGSEGDGLLTLSPEQEAELLRFQDEKLRIRKELRDVRHRMDQEIDSLGSTLKFVNVVLLPLILTGLLLLGYRLMGQRS